MLFSGEMEMEPSVPDKYQTKCDHRTVMKLAGPSVIQYVTNMIQYTTNMIEHGTNIIQYITNCMMHRCYEVFDHELFSMRKCPVEDG